MTGRKNVLARALVVTACCGMVVACADAPASRGAKATATSGATRAAIPYPAVECAGCAPLARAQLAAKTPTGSSFVFVYDLGAERIYKYEVSQERPVTEMIPVDKEVRVAFDALVTANHDNPELVRAGRLRIQMPATLSDEPATSEQ